MKRAGLPRSASRPADAKAEHHLARRGQADRTSPPPLRCVFEGALTATLPLTTTPQETIMSKGMDQKKNTKKEPTKTLKEKRAAKQAKKK